MGKIHYKPSHPMADKDGWVKHENLYDYYVEEDKSYTRGNQKVTVHYIPDEMAPTRHMIDGKHYTSKKKFRNETKARGCVEVGNETATLLKPRKPIELDKRQRRDDIKRAIWEIRNGRDIKREFGR